jgi:hypothetical protein
MKKIVWLASYPKSGNTWVRFLLANLLYPQFAPMPLNKIGGLFPGDQNRVLFEGIVGRSAAKMTMEEMHAARGLLQKYYASQDRTMFVKTHSAFVKEKRHWHINPRYTEGAILIVRDPRDVVCSMLNHFSTDHKSSARWLGDFERVLLDVKHPSLWCRTLDWSGHYQSWTQRLGSRCCIVRYEDLIGRPITVMKRVLSFIHHEASDEAIANAISHSSFDKLKQIEEKEGFVEQSSEGTVFFHTGRKGRWVDEMDPEVARKIEGDHGVVMRRLGYLD